MRGFVRHGFGGMVAGDGERGDRGVNGAVQSANHGVSLQFRDKRRLALHQERVGEVNRGERHAL